MDWYKFTLTEDCRINIYGTIVSTDCPYDYFTQKVNLYNSKELLIAETAFNRDASLGQQSSKPIGLESGTYYLSVPSGDPNWPNDEYVLNIHTDSSEKWETEGYNNSKNGALEIEANSDVHGMTDQHGADWYKFTLTEDCRINVYGTIVSTDCPYNYFTHKINLYNSEELLIAEDAFYRDPSLGEQTSKPIGLKSGTYYISVPGDDPNWPNDEYILNIHTDTSEKWETEGYNNSLKRAQEIDANTDIYGITDKNNADWYKFILPEDCKINVLGTIVRTDCPYNYYTQKINLYDSGENLIREFAFYRDISLGEQSSDSIELESGTYYLSIPSGDPNWPNDEYIIKIQLTKADGLQLGDDKKYYYYKDGKVDTDFTGYAEYDGAKFYVKNGTIDTATNGVKIDGNADPLVWYFCANGQVQTQHKGLALYDGEWFYIENGKVAVDMNAFVEYDGGLFAVAAGRIVSEYSGLMQDPQNTKTGDWYFFADGKAQTQYTGLAQYDGHWFYIQAGKFDPAYNGKVTYDGAEFTVVNGEAQVQ